MTCPICGVEMITAKATDFGDPYYYCRTCKKELLEMLLLEDTGVVFSPGITLYLGTLNPYELQRIHKDGNV